MNLGLINRQAIVCASSQGLGLACALALSAEGCHVFINGRAEAKLQSAAAQIRAATGNPVTPVVADLASEEGRRALVEACAAPDILVTNNAGPPPGSLADWDHGAWVCAIESNMLAPILLIRSVIPGMRARRFGRIVNITSAMVKSPHALMGLSTAPRAGLTAFCKALSKDVARDNVTINNLLPERIDTDRQRFMAEKLAAEKSISFEQARQEIAMTIAAQRFGTPEEFGAACAFLCASQSGYISGQNLQLDGGSYEGLI